MDGNAWEDMSSEYDNSVEKNPDPVISNYLSNEIRIVSDLCKKIIRPDTKYTVIDMGSGTGRVLFELFPVLGDFVSYYGLDASNTMIQLSKKKQSKLQSNISFVNFDVTDPAIDKLFDDDSIKITMCMFNTIGVIPSTKRQQFFDTMVRLAGKKGLSLISAFNGDDFTFAAPRLYHPMKKMVKQIDEDSFDEEKLAFKNKNGYYSQWFRKNQLLEMLHSNATPIPINISLNNSMHTFGHVFTNRKV